MKNGLQTTINYNCYINNKYSVRKENGHKQTAFFVNKKYSMLEMKQLQFTIQFML